MRILIVGEDPHISGGVAGYAAPIAESLASSGHVVEYIYSGCRRPIYDMQFRRHWNETTRGGVPFAGLANPHSLTTDGRTPSNDVYGTDAHWYLKRARRFHPDLVHIHSFVGIPVDFVRRAAEFAPVIVTAHEFGLVCQRRVLVQRDHSLCGTYASQIECPGCVERVVRGRYALRARLGGTFGGAPLRTAQHLQQITGVRVSVDEEIEPRGAVTPEALTAAPWQERLHANTRIINASASVVTAVSSHVRDVLVACGFDANLIRVMHIGSSSAEALSPTPLPSLQTGRTTFLFMSGLVPHKGPHVLLEAWRMLGRDASLIVAGGTDTDYARSLMSTAPKGVEFFGRYSAVEREELLARSDVLVAPAVGPDTSPQVVLESLAAGRPVVGSRIGGIPDFVLDNVNGRLVAPGDPEQLRDVLEQLSTPGEVARLARGVARPKSVAEHIGDLETLYDETVKSFDTRAS